MIRNKNMSGPIQQSIENKLKAAFAPLMLEVINESHQHAGHQEHFDGTGETHFRVKIIAAQFASMSRIERHRAITNLLAPELDNGLHALAIEAQAPNK